MNPLRRAMGALALLSLLVTLAVGSGAPTADAQQRVVGAADFRGAPQLVPGQYQDTIVTGDNAWYSLVYTNNTPYKFDVSFAGAAPGDAELVATFVAPTLSNVSGPSASIDGRGVEYPSGHTNVWFLKVSLMSSGQAGIEYPIIISVDGVLNETIEPCREVPGCTLDTEFAALTDELDLAKANLAELRAQETTENVTAEIQNLKGFIETSDLLTPKAQARQARAEATMARLCDPDPICTEFPQPAPRPVVLGLILGFGALGLGGYRALNRFRNAPEDGESKPDGKGNGGNGGGKGDGGTRPPEPTQPQGPSPAQSEAEAAVFVMTE